MQKKIRVVILVVVLLFVFCWIRDFCIKSLIGTVTSSITGAPTHIGGLSLSIIKQSVRISNFRMYNPKGFSKDILVDIPKIGVACNLKALVTGRIHLKHLELEIKEIGMVKNKDGKLNVDSLKIVAEKSGKKEKKPGKQPVVQIDIVSLDMGRVVSRDYSAGGNSSVVKVYDINLKKTYKNITSVQQLIVLIISEPLKVAGIQGLKMYGAAMFAGVAFLPVGVVFTLTGKDYAQGIFNLTIEQAYDAGFKAIKIAGKVQQENKADGLISAEVDGAKVILKLKKLSEGSTQVTISAREFGLPKPEIASGVMYRLKEQLK